MRLAYTQQASNHVEYLRYYQNFDIDEFEQKLASLELCGFNRCVIYIKNGCLAIKLEREEERRENELQFTGMGV